MFHRHSIGEQSLKTEKRPQECPEYSAFMQVQLVQMHLH